MFTSSISSALRLTYTSIGVLGLVGALTSCSTQPTLTAEQVVSQLVAQVHTATPAKVITAENDPNKLLGRPGGYTSKAELADNRIKLEPPPSDGMESGGSVEVYPDTNGATKRREYIESVHQAAPILGTEYDYQSGPILLRVSQQLTPDQAGEYKTALDNIASGKAAAPAPTPPAPPAMQVPAPSPATVSVESVHDAATVVLSDGTHLRQVGISAPSADTCQAKQATATTDTEVRRGPLTYQLLGQADVYGNQWAYLQVAGADFGEKLASLGWVWAYPDSPAPQAYNQRITNQVDTARAANAGMFGTTCPGPAPAPPAGIAPAAGQPAVGASAQSMGGDGTFVVGTDVQAGNYHTSGPAPDSPGGFCTWIRRKDTSGDFTSAITAGTTKGPTTVTIKPTDGAFETHGCAQWTKTN